MTTPGTSRSSGHGSPPLSARAWADSDPTRGSTFADEAARIAEDLDDTVLLAEALDARLATCAGPDDLVARLETSMWLAEVACGA